MPHNAGVAAIYGPGTNIPDAAREVLELVRNVRGRAREGACARKGKPMKYCDGQEMKLGDRVRLGADDGGVVVFIVDTGEYSEAYPESEWGGYLKTGAMIEFPKYGLIHYEEPEEDLELIERAGA